jgi:hypothetical protein
MHERTQERQDLQEELTALRRQARDAERVGPRRVQLHWALQAVRRDQDAANAPTARRPRRHRAAAGPVPRGPGDRGSVTAKVDKVRNAGHADLVEATPVVAQALKRVAAGTARIRELLRERLPSAAVTPRSLLEHD